MYFPNVKPDDGLNTYTIEALGEQTLEADKTFQE